MDINLRNIHFSYTCQIRVNLSHGKSYRLIMRILFSLIDLQTLFPTEACIFLTLIIVHEYAATGELVFTSLIMPSVFPRAAKKAWEIWQSRKKAPAESGVYYRNMGPVANVRNHCIKRVKYSICRQRPGYFKNECRVLYHVHAVVHCWCTDMVTRTLIRAPSTHASCGGWTRYSVGIFGLLHHRNSWHHTARNKRRAFLRLHAVTPQNTVIIVAQK